MKIILNVHNQKLINDREKYIRKYISDKADAVRVNLSKSNEINDLIQSVLYLKQMIKQDIMLDIPVPYQKYRGYLSDIPEMDMLSNVNYALYFNKADAVSRGDIFFDHIPDIDINTNNKLIYGDGEALIKIISVHERYLLCQPENDFRFINGKAFYFGDVRYSLGDVNYMDTILNAISKIQPKMLCLSFVHTVDEVEKIKAYFNNGMKIIAKIEDEIGIKNISEISSVADAIMVGRGDLAICTDPCRLWSYQKMILKKVSNVYIATDILNSCRDRMIPSRADIMDLSEIIYDGAEGIVLPVGLMDVNRTIEFVKQVEKNIKENEVY